MKRCTMCRAEKPLDAFHRARVGAGGRQARCKDCKSALARARYQSRPEAICAKAKAYRDGLGDERIERDRARRLRDAPKLIERVSRLRATHPERFAARHAVQSALRAGRITKPDACARCGEAKKLTAHHWSYEVAHHIDVEWLCYPCHAAEHAAARTGRRAA